MLLRTLSAAAVAACVFAAVPATAVAQAEPAGITTRVKPDGLDGEAFTDSLYAHEPIYLVGGGSPKTDLKFQVSFKARIYRRAFLGYTQLNHWNISEDSAPFRDTTHKPSLFWYEPVPQQSSGMRWGYTAGYEHNSNGRAGPDSRSLDTLFVRPTLVFGDETDHHFRVSPKVYAYVNKGSKNQDIADYRRNLDLHVSYQTPDEWGATLQHRLGRGDKGSTQLEFSVPWRAAGLGWKGYLMLQVFDGTGETLLDYNVKGPTQVRVGYLFERAR